MKNKILRMLLAFTFAITILSGCFPMRHHDDHGHGGPDHHDEGHR